MMPNSQKNGNQENDIPDWREVMLPFELRRKLPSRRELSDISPWPKEKIDFFSARQKKIHEYLASIGVEIGETMSYKEAKELIRRELESPKETR